MGSCRRLQKEVRELRGGLPCFRDLELVEEDLFRWTGLLLPEAKPFSSAAFRIEIRFPKEYPFRPPGVIFLTPIYHPNVSETGEVCLEAVSTERWKPSTKAQQVIEALAELVNKPQAEHALRPEIGEEYLKEQKKFIKNATDHAKKHGEKRPF